MVKFLIAIIFYGGIASKIPFSVSFFSPNVFVRFFAVSKINGTAISLKNNYSKRVLSESFGGFY